MQKHESLALRPDQQNTGGNVRVVAVLQADGSAQGGGEPNRLPNT